MASKLTPVILINVIAVATLFMFRAQAWHPGTGVPSVTLHAPVQKANPLGHANVIDVLGVGSVTGGISAAVAAVNGDVPLPFRSPVNVAAPVPPCATVTAALLVRTVELAFGSVKVFSDVAGPVNLVNPFPVPPLVDGRMPVIPVVSEIWHQAGLLPVPVLHNARVALVSLASSENMSVAEA